MHYYLRCCSVVLTAFEIIYLFNYLYYHSWWGRRNCPDYAKPSTDETSELQIENVAGVFFILVGGVAVAAVVCLGEYFAKQISNSVKKV